MALHQWPLHRTYGDLKTHSYIYMYIWQPGSHHREAPEKPPPCLCDGRLVLFSRLWPTTRPAVLRVHQINATTTSSIPLGWNAKAGHLLGRAANMPHIWLSQTTRWRSTYSPCLKHFKQAVHIKTKHVLLSKNDKFTLIAEVKKENRNRK